MDGRVDETSHVIFLGKFVNNKKYKEQILQEIIAAICAMLNSNGGIVVVHINPDTIIPVGFSSPQMSSVIRILEQSMISIIGSHQTVSKMNFKEDENSIVIFIKKADSLIITNYNLCLPSKTQVVQTSSLESLEKIKDDIMNRKDILEPVQLGSHCKTFVEDKNCDFHECKISMLKNLKASSSKRTKLADRMTGKGNKFSCYVSAFANYNGGHMYYGIRDDGIVEGEWIPIEDISEIRNKVEKAVNKMIWPQHIGQPKRGEHWDIFFEPVLDENSKPIPSTYVIVIYIAPCLGGVFTEEPECYEMVEEKVQKMSFATWRKRISQPTELFYADKPKRITWISTKTRNICVAADQLLTQSVNDGESIVDISQYLERSFPNLIEVTLVVLSKKVMAGYRSSFFIKAKKLLHDYSDLLGQTSEFAIFEAIHVYLKTALYRAQGDIQSLRDILAGALDKAENIVPGLISAAIYLLVATVMYLFQSEGCSPDLFSTLALEHLQYVQDSPIVRADMEQKSHITSALFYLGSNMSGELTREEIDIKSLEKAKSSVKAVHKSIDEGNPMNNYREIQFNVVRSVLCYRQSQVQSDGKIPFLQEAFNFSKRAEYLSSEYNFTEMLYWARACMAVYTAELVRTHFKPNANTPHYFACNQEPGTSKRLYCNFTSRYNLYLPTNQQVIEISPKDPVEKVKDILCKNILSPEAVKPGSHVKEFTLGTAVDFRESKTVQFKQLFAKRTNNTSLVQRFIKQSKFPSYVSAFANHSGGHIYIGVRDDGIVQGEKITPQDQTELKKEISKAIGSMIWPDNSDTQDGEEKRWQINFEEVKNTNGEIVPSTFVIVTYVAQCPGGVFTKQPESYEIKENEVKMIDFPTWKKCIVEGLERDKESPESWKWEKNSIIHREKFIKLHEYGQEHPEEIQDISTQPKGPFLYPESTESWKWEKNSIIHREKFIKLHEYGQEHPEEIQDISTQPKGPFLYPESTESWKWEKNSIIHREKFIKLHEYGQEHPEEIQDISGVRVCCSKEFRIGTGSGVTRVYIGLGKDGYERAVKRLLREDCDDLAEQENKVLNELNTTESNFVVKYRFLDDKSNKDWLFLIMNLCEETLKEFVERSSLDDLKTNAQTIIQQVLTGLADLHRDPKPILHRDLKPSNILRNVKHKWLLADFGISRIMTQGVSTFRSKEKGTQHWKAVESCSTNDMSDDDDVRYKKKSDIQVAGMVAFYILTKGKHPFGEEPDRHRNLLDGNPVYLDKLEGKPAAKDLISWMLNHDPKDRPSAQEALKHPYLQSKKQQFEMLCKVGNEEDILTGNVISDVVRMLNSDPKDWRSLMNADVLQYLSTDPLKGKTFRYKSSWTDCLRLIRNVKAHWHHRPRPRPELFYVLGDPQEYFLNLFPNLPVVVHEIIRSCDWKERPDLQEYFI